mmetsp:Transcript_12555/g.31889  ORF Transcript_12555/g.31889 Transcript_12555/m.31889 type:complete len:1411 (-) Transcript_12555:123-4355(-)
MQFQVNVPPPPPPLPPLPAHTRQSLRPLPQMLATSLGRVNRGDLASLCAPQISTLSYNPVTRFALRLQQTIDMSLLFRRLSDLTDITLTDQATHELYVHPRSFEFVDSDIVTVGVRVKHLNIIDDAEGMALSIKASHTTGLRERIRLSQLACVKFESALSSSPNNFLILYHWAEALEEQSRYVMEKQQVIELMESAVEKYRSALHVNPRFGKAALRLGSLHIQLALNDPSHDSRRQFIEKAGKYFSDALDINPDYYKLLVDQAQSFLDCGKQADDWIESPDEAEYIPNNSDSVTSSQCRLLLSCACVTCRALTTRTPSAEAATALHVLWIHALLSLFRQVDEWDAEYTPLCFELRTALEPLPPEAFGPLHALCVQLRSEYLTTRPKMAHSAFLLYTHCAQLRIPAIFQGMHVPDIACVHNAPPVRGGGLRVPGETPDAWRSALDAPHAHPPLSSLRPHSPPLMGIGPDEECERGEGAASLEEGGRAEGSAVDARGREFDVCADACPADAVPTVLLPLAECSITIAMHSTCADTCTTERTLWQFASALVSLAWRADGACTEALLAGLNRIALANLALVSPAAARLIQRECDLVLAGGVSALELGQLSDLHAPPPSRPAGADSLGMASCPRHCAPLDLSLSTSGASDSEGLECDRPLLPRRLSAMQRPPSTLRKSADSLAVPLRKNTEPLTGSRDPAGLHTPAAAPTHSDASLLVRGDMLMAQGANLARLAPAFRHITTLTIYSCERLDQEHLCHFIRTCTRIASLELFYMGLSVTEETVEAIQALALLERLVVRGCASPSLKRLMAALSQTRISSLLLADCAELRFDALFTAPVKKIEKSEAFPIGNSSHVSPTQPFQALSHVVLDKCNGVGDESLAYFAESAQQLTSLVLKSLPRLTDNGLENLRVMTRLEELRIDDCTKVSDDGLLNITALQLTALCLKTLPKMTNVALAGVCGCETRYEADNRKQATMTKRLQGRTYATVQALYSHAEKARPSWKKQSRPVHARPPCAMATLKRLRIENCKAVTDEGMSFIAKLMCATPLCELVLKKLTNVTNDGIAALLDSGACLDELESFDISCNKGVTGDVLAHRATYSLTRLHTLRIGRLTVRDSDVARLLQQNTALHTLDLSECCHIASTLLNECLPSLLQLSVLHLSDVPLDPLAFGWIGRQCLQLTSLHLRRCLDKVQLSSRLSWTSSHPYLTDLDISSCSKLNDRRITNILLHAPALRFLDLSSCPHISSATVRFAAVWLGALQVLHLSRCTRLTDQALKALGMYCKNLVEVSLWNHPLVTDDGVSYLVLHCPSLQVLTVRDCKQVSEACVRRLSAARPHIHISAPNRMNPLNIKSAKLFQEMQAAAGHGGDNHARHAPPSPGHFQELKAPARGLPLFVAKPSAAGVRLPAPVPLPARPP